MIEEINCDNNINRMLYLQCAFIYLLNICRRAAAMNPSDDVTITTDRYNKQVKLFRNAHLQQW